MEKMFLVIQLLTFQNGETNVTEYPTRYQYADELRCSEWGNYFTESANELINYYLVENLKYSYRCVSKNELDKIKDRFKSP